VGSHTVDSWLNPIQTLRRWLRQDVIKRHRRAGDCGRWLAAMSGYPDQFGEPSSAPLHSCGRIGDGRLALALGAAG